MLYTPTIESDIIRDHFFLTEQHSSRRGMKNFRHDPRLKAVEYAEFKTKDPQLLHTIHTLTGMLVLSWARVRSELCVSEIQIG